MGLQELYREIKGVNGWRLALIVLFKPMIPLELIALTGFRKNYITFVFKRFLDKGIAICLFPGKITGRIYSLTNAGRKLRRMFVDELNETEWKEFLDKGVAYKFIDFPPGLDMDLYRHVVSGKDRREFIMLMENILVNERKGCFTPRDIFEFYRNEEKQIDITKGKQTPSTEIYRAAWDFVRLGILSSLRIGKRGVAFKLTEQGRIIAGQFQHRHFKLIL